MKDLSFYTRILFLFTLVALSVIIMIYVVVVFNALPLEIRRTRHGEEVYRTNERIVSAINESNSIFVLFDCFDPIVFCVSRTHGVVS